MVTAIVLLSLLAIFQGFMNYNLYRKVNVFKMLTENFQKMFYEIFTIIDDSDKKLNALDKRGSFSGDDEVGFFFKEVKKIQNLLNYFSNNVRR